jgi:hypothetical protein
MKNSLSTRLLLIAVFAVAMAYFEAAVVVYLREIFYPDGFSFPLRSIPGRLLVIELLREASTMIILIAVALITGRRFWERFGYFLILFGIWDIFYYFWLKVIAGWPASIFDWDILFLIPLPWIGPVIAPLLVAVLMVVFGYTMVRLYNLGGTFRPTSIAWITSIIATVMVLYTFMHDWDATLSQQLPRDYLYGAFFAGILLYMIGFWDSYRKSS